MLANGGRPVRGDDTDGWGVLEHVVEESDIASDLTRPPERRPEEVDPGEVVRFPVPHFWAACLAREGCGADGRHEPVEGLYEVPVVEDDDPIAGGIRDPEVRIDDADTICGAWASAHQRAE